MGEVFAELERDLERWKTQNRGKPRAEMLKLLLALEREEIVGLLLGGPIRPCADAADANDTGVVDISDPILTLNALFVGGVGLPGPTGAQEFDPTPDELRCVR